MKFAQGTQLIEPQAILNPLALPRPEMILGHPPMLGRFLIQVCLEELKSELPSIFIGVKKHRGNKFIVLRELATMLFGIYGLNQVYQGGSD